MLFEIKNIIVIFILGESESSVRFFAKNMTLFKKQNEKVHQSKYCPSLAMTFSHLSGSKRILRRKNDSSLEAIQSETHFSTHYSS